MATLLDDAGAGLEVAASRTKNELTRDAREKLGKGLGVVGKGLALAQAYDRDKITGLLVESGKIGATAALAGITGTGAIGGIAFGAVVDVTYDQLHYQYVVSPHLFDEEDALRALQEQNEDKRREQYFGRMQESGPYPKSLSTFDSSSFTKVDPETNAPLATSDQEAVTPSASGAESGWQLVGRYSLQDQQMRYEALQGPCVASTSFSDFLADINGAPASGCRVLSNDHDDRSSKVVAMCQVFTDFGTWWGRDIWETKLGSDQSIETIYYGTDLDDRKTVRMESREMYRQCKVQPIDCSAQGKAALAANYDASDVEAMCQQ
jgi:hypothetical protein